MHFEHAARSTLAILFLSWLAPPFASAQPAPAAPAPAATPPEESTSSFGYDKGFYIKDRLNSLVIQGRVQPRFTHLGVDGGTNQDSFSIARARLTLKGTALIEHLSYKFQTDFGKGNPALKDFYVDYCLLDKMLCVRPGQFKKPFSRQHITSSGNLELVDRSITDKAFGAGRDIGIMLHDNYEKSPTFEYALGFFNGTGDKAGIKGSGSADLTTGDVSVSSSQSNVPGRWDPALVLRLGYNHGGIAGYSEADLEGGPLRFAVGGSVETHFDADKSGDSTVACEIDAILKVEGLSVSAALFQASDQDGNGYFDRSPGDGGGHFQVGYVLAERYQPALRFGYVDPRHDDSDNLLSEYLLGFNYFVVEHSLKWQTDAGALVDKASDSTDFQFRSQLQLSF